MLKSSKAMLLSLSLLVFAGCVQLPSGQQLPPSLESVAVVTALGRGDRTAVIDLGAATQPRSTQAVHKWTKADITKYVVRLRVQSGAGASAAFRELDPAVAVDVPQGEGGKTKAAFRGLSQGRYYRAYVEAWGHEAGTDRPDVQLNTQDAWAFVDFDFTGEQDVEDSATGSVRVTFDPVGFEGRAGVTFEDPGDGAYDSSASTPSADAE